MHTPFSRRRLHEVVPGHRAHAAGSEFDFIPTHRVHPGADDSYYRRSIHRLFRRPTTTMVSVYPVSFSDLI